MLRSNLLKYLQAGQCESSYCTMSYLLLWCCDWSPWFDCLSPAPTECSMLHCSDHFCRYKDSPFCSLTNSPSVLHFSGFHHLWTRHFFLVLNFCRVFFLGGLGLVGFFQNYEFCSPSFALLALPLLWYLNSITSTCALVLYHF